MNRESDTPDPDLRLLVVEAAQRLQDGQGDSEIASLFAKHYHHPASIRMLVKKARELQKSWPLPSPTAQRSADTSRQTVSRHQENSGDAKLNTHQGQRRLSEQPIGLNAPFLLLASKSLTAAEKQGLQAAAQTVYDSIVAGSDRECTVRSLSTDLHVDASAARNLVDAIDLHVRPGFSKKRGSTWLGRMLMALALVLPYCIFRVSTVSIRSIVQDEIFVLLLVVALMVMYPKMRSSLGQKAIGWRRRNSPDGIVVLASDRRKPVLYLRSHCVDGSGRDPESYWSHFFLRTEMMTLEERISASLSVVGPVVALEGPREGLPNLGAARIRRGDMENADWKQLVLGLICRSSQVVVRFRPTESMCWEVEQLLRLCLPNQLLFILAEPRDSAAIREKAWVRLRPMLASFANGVLPERVRCYDYLLGFDAESRPVVFGRRKRFRSEDAAFLEALTDATIRHETMNIWDHLNSRL